MSYFFFQISLTKISREVSMQLNVFFCLLFLYMFLTVSVLTIILSISDNETRNKET